MSNIGNLDIFATWRRVGLVVKMSDFIVIRISFVGKCSCVWKKNICYGKLFPVMKMGF